MKPDIEVDPYHAGIAERSDLRAERLLADALLLEDEHKRGGPDHALRIRGLRLQADAARLDARAARMHVEATRLNDEGLALVTTPPFFGPEQE